MEKQFLASGTEKNVYRVGNDFVQVEARKKWSREEALSAMHLAKIAHILFPKNIPTPILVKKDETTGKYNLVFEYIDHANDPEHTNLTEVRNSKGGGILNFSLDDDIRVDNFFHKVNQEEDFLHLKESLDVAGFSKYEIQPYNVISDKSRNFIFIDFEPAFWSHSVSLNEKSFFNFDIAKLVDYIDKNTSGVTKELARKELKSILMLLPDDYQKHFLEKYNL